MDAETLDQLVDLVELLLCQIDRSRRQVLENTILLAESDFQAHSLSDHLP